MNTIIHMYSNVTCMFCHIQSTAMAFDEVNEHNVYLCTGQPLPTDIAQIVEWMLNQDFSTAYESIYYYTPCRVLRALSSLLMSRYQPTENTEGAGITRYHHSNTHLRTQRYMYQQLALAHTYMYALNVVR